MTRAILPSGLWLEDRVLQDADLQPMTGYDEAYLLSLSGTLSPARWTSEILARCLTSIGNVSPVPMEYVQTLTVGDREALLLHLRRLTFGERMSCVLDCPQCGTKLDFDLDVQQLLLPPYQDAAYWFRVPLKEESLIVTFRLPTGADQEAVADLAAKNPQSAASVLLTRCLHSITQEGVELDTLPDKFTPLLADLISNRDPQAELVLNGQCPDCEQMFAMLLDMGQFFAQEINHRIDTLYREVHLLAWYYHWSELEILQMTRPHRQIYLDLLDETLSEAKL